MHTLSKLFPLPLQQFSLLLILALALFACGEQGGGGVVGGDVGDLQVAPDSINFPQVAIGDSRVDQLRISNAGESVISLWDLGLADTEDADSRAFTIVNSWSGTHRLEAGDQIILDIEYAPVEAIRYGGVLSFQTNIAGSEVVEVDIVAGTPRPEIFAPENVIFSRIAQGESDWRLLEVSNIGYAPLEIDSISLETADEFSLSYPTVTGSGSDLSVGPANSDSSSHPSSLSPGETLYVRITYTAVDDQFRNDRIRIDSNDPSSPVKLVALTANSNAPCLEVGSSEVNFGMASIGNTSNRIVALTNCSEVAETVLTGVEMNNTADGVFAVIESSLPGLLADGGNAVLGPRETVNVFVSYTPTEEVVDEGELTIRSNDIATPVRRLPVIGQGSTYECPIAAARARIQGTTQWQTDTVSAIPLDFIEFSGEDSYDPDGTSLTYEWSILNRPIGSGAVFTPNATNSTPQMMLDIAGRYTVELTVYDEFGISACEPAQIQLEAAPNADIHVELTWEVPSSPSRTGTDLDLHYKHPSGAFGAGGLYEVFYANRGPLDWGDDGTVSLDWDDLTGIEPENINHDNPGGSPGNVRTYSVGVYYFSDSSSWGNSVATVRVYLGGNLVRERIRTLQNGGSFGALNGDFWWVADIPWDGVSLDVIDVDEVYSGFAAIPQ